MREHVVLIQIGSRPSQVGRRFQDLADDSKIGMQTSDIHSTPQARDVPSASEIPPSRRLSDPQAHSGLPAASLLWQKSAVVSSQGDGKTSRWARISATPRIFGFASVAVSSTSCGKMTSSVMRAIISARSSQRQRLIHANNLMKEL